MSRKTGLGKFLGGIALGAGLGILLAPDKGENTRKALKKKVDELLAKIKEIDVAEVKDELMYKAETLKAELASLDKEKVKEIALDKANKIKAKAEELYKLAIEKSTPVVEKATDEVRKQALKVVKDLEKKLDNKKEK